MKTMLKLLPVLAIVVSFALGGCGGNGRNTNLFPGGSARTQLRFYQHVGGGVAAAPHHEVGCTMDMNAIVGNLANRTLTAGQQLKGMREETGLFTHTRYMFQ